MTDAARELTELKKEIVEARNQAIKTDHQVKNIALDVKGFEKRFDTLERRTRMASVAVHMIVALTIAAAAALIGSVRNSNHQQELAALKAEMQQVSAATEQKEQQLNERLRQIEALETRGKASRKAAEQIVTLLDARKERDAADLIPNVHLEDLTPLEQKLVGKRIAELRREGAEAAYKAGKSLLAAGRTEAAVKELARSLKLEPQGPLSEKSRYLQATTLYSLKRFDQAEPVLRELLSQSGDKALREEVQFLLGITLARLGKRDDARKMLQASASGRYQGVARSYLAALDNGGPLPGDGPSSKKTKATASTAGE